MFFLIARDFLQTSGLRSRKLADFLPRLNFCHAIIYHPRRVATKDRDKIISFQIVFFAAPPADRAVRNRAIFSLCSLSPVVLSQDLLPVTFDQYLLCNKIIYNRRFYYLRSIAYFCTINNSVLRIIYSLYS